MTGITSSTPDVPGAPGEERAEATPSPALPGGGPTITDPLESEEDWAAMATGDPALWLKQ